MDFETTNYIKDHFKTSAIRDSCTCDYTGVDAHYMDMTGPKSCPAAPVTDESVPRDQRIDSYCIILHTWMPSEQLINMNIMLTKPLMFYCYLFF